MGPKPLGDLQLSSGDFAELARIVRDFVPRPGRWALFLEGGYQRAALASCVAAALGVLLDQLGADRTVPRRAVDGAHEEAGSL